MKTSGFASVAATVLSGALFATSVAAADLPPIVIKGSHFFYENGTEFFIKGIAYQQDVGTNGSTSRTSLEPTDFTIPSRTKLDVRVTFLSLLLWVSTPSESMQSMLH